MAAKNAFVAFRVSQQLVDEFDEAIVGLPGDRSDHMRQALLCYIHDQRRVQDALRLLEDDGGPSPVIPDLELSIAPFGAFVDTL